MSLNEYFRTNQGRPINKWTHYLPIYERYFSAYRDRRIVFLEIGSGQGGSSQMWKHYFGPTAQIVSIDVRPECMAFQDEQVAIRIGDQGDPKFLQSLIDEFGAPDIVLDDGSHHMMHVNASFDYLYGRMPREALYVVEDTHTCYWHEWGGGLRKPGTFMERMKTLLDEMYAENPHNPARAKDPIPGSDTARMTRGVHFYDSMVILEKGNFISKFPLSIPFKEGETIW